jgi:hypothetical protein
MLQFGIGALFARPVGGNAATPSFPQQFGIIQDVSLDITQKLVSLFGQNKFPDDVAPSDMEIKGKAGFGKIDIHAYNTLFFADTIATGMVVSVMNEEHNVPTTEPAAWADAHAYSLGAMVTDGTRIHVCVTAGTSGGSAPSWKTVVGQYTADGSVVWQCAGLDASGVTVTEAGDFEQDYGVIYKDTGIPFKLVTSSPAVGEYMVTAGVYTFNAADIGEDVLISYTYDETTGSTLTVENHLQGYGPIFEMLLAMPYQGNNCLRLFRCRSSKMSLPMKRDGYAIPDFEFSAFPNSSSQVMEWCQAV